MTWCLIIMHNDDHDKNFNYFLTSGMLQSFPLKEISSRDYKVRNALGWVVEKETCQTHKHSSGSENNKSWLEITNEIKRQS